MRRNTQRGATLALVAATALIIILVGVGLFFIMKIIGGNRELNNATEAGNLNVARGALRTPNVPLSGVVAAANFSGLGDPNNGGNINLLTYNRAVGQTLLVAFNAKEDTGAGSARGRTNAQTLVTTLQTGVGGALRTQLGAGASTNNLFQVATWNTTRLLGLDSAVGNNLPDYATAWVEQTPQVNPDFPGDRARNMSSNLEIPRSLQLRINLPTTATSLKTVRLPNGTRGQRMFLRGYTNLSATAGLSTTAFMGLPLNPFEQPHLISQQTFDAGTPPLPGVPPNAFRSGGQTREARTNMFSRSIARSVVGTTGLPIFGNTPDTANPANPNSILSIPGNNVQGPTFPLSIPRGYVVVNNNGDLTFTGTLPGTGHVLDDELDPTIGIRVDRSSNHFSTDQGVIDSWKTHMNTPHSAGDPHDASQPWGNNPPVTNLYQGNGDPATTNSAHGISADTSPSAVATCTDMNSSPGAAGMDSTCVNELTNGAFDRAYSPPGTSYVGNTGTAGGLMAVEEVKCRVLGRFNSCGNIAGTNTATGLRKFVRNPLYGGYQWSASNGLPRCRISVDGTIGELFDQAEDGEADNAGAGAAKRAAAEDYIRLRCVEIKPDATTAEINAILNRPVPILSGNTPQFIYMNAARQLRFDTNTPPGFSPATADGSTFRADRSYGTVNTYVNPPREADIHDRLFRSEPAPFSITGRDIAEIDKSSGFGNLLGVINFQNRATGSGGRFCDPD